MREKRLAKGILECRVAVFAPFMKNCGKMKKEVTDALEASSLIKQTTGSGIISCIVTSLNSSKYTKTVG